MSEAKVKADEESKAKAEEMAKEQTLLLCRYTKALIQEQGFTQLRIQKILGWGRSYISQMLTGRKAVKVEALLQILDVLGIPMPLFFDRFFKWQEAETAAPGGAAAERGGEPPLHPQVASMHRWIRAVGRYLLERHLIPVEDWERLLAESGMATDREPQAKPRKRRKTAAG